MFPAVAVFTTAKPARLGLTVPIPTLPPVVTIAPIVLLLKVAIKLPPVIKMLLDVMFEATIFCPVRELEFKFVIVEFVIKLELTVKLPTEALDIITVPLV
jgi:hypothetical protein